MKASTRYGLAASMLLVVLAGPAVAQEIRPTLDKIKETGTILLGHRETSRPFSFLGTDGQPAGYSVDLCLQVAAAVKQHLKLADLKMNWVLATPADRVSKLVKGTIDLECGSTTITFGRMEQVAFSHMIFVDGASLLATTASGVRGVKDLTGKRYNLGTHIAAIYAALGNKDEALAWLTKACDEHEQGVVDLKVDPRLDTLRADPRFVDLLRRVKLAP